MRALRPRGCARAALAGGGAELSAHAGGPTGRRRTAAAADDDANGNGKDEPVEEEEDTARETDLLFLFFVCLHALLFLEQRMHGLLFFDSDDMKPS